MRNITALLAAVLFLSCSVQKQQRTKIQEPEIERILKTLAADDMQVSPGIEKAASFIENEFREAGLQPLQGEESFRQQFTVTRIKPSSTNISINGNSIADSQVIVYTDKGNLDWNSNVEVINITPGENFFNRFNDIIRQKKEMLVLVDPSYSLQFNNLSGYVSEGRIV
jgi:hypothetical protein